MLQAMQQMPLNKSQLWLYNLVKDRWHNPVLNFKHHHQLQLQVHPHLYGTRSNLNQPTHALLRCKAKAIQWRGYLEAAKTCQLVPLIMVQVNSRLKCYQNRMIVDLAAQTLSMISMGAKSNKNQFNNPRVGMRLPVASLPRLILQQVSHKIRTNLQQVLNHQGLVQCQTRLLKSLVGTQGYGTNLMHSSMIMITLTSSVLEVRAAQVLSSRFE